MGDRRSPVWPRPAPDVERAASHPSAPCPAGHAHSTPRPSAGARDAAPPGSGPFALPHQVAPAALVLVVGTGPARPCRGLAGVCRPLLDRAYLPFLQADTQVDHPQAARPGGRRPLDVADAEFESERHHHHICEQLGADSIIPAKRGRPTWRLHGIRAQMRARCPAARYRQRALVESVFSAAKRKLSSRAPGRLPVTQHLQTLLLGLAYDIYRVRRAPLFSLA